MAKDDLNVIMFKILVYLYDCTKSGEKVKQSNFNAGNNYFAKGLKQEYINSICLMLEENNYTKGFSATTAWGGDVIMTSYDAKITIEGFEYLKENKLMKKVYNFLKETKGWIPSF